MQAPSSPEARETLATSVRASVADRFDSWSRVEAAQTALLDALLSQGILSPVERAMAHIEESEDDSCVALFVGEDAFLLHTDGDVEAF